MTTTFGVNQNNDIFIEANGNLSVLNAQDAVAAACLTASKAQLGEMVLATTTGIPNFQTVWVGAPNLALFESFLRKTLLDVDGVTGVQSLTVSEDDNVLNYTAKISTEFDPTNPVTISTAEISND